MVDLQRRIRIREMEGYAIAAELDFTRDGPVLRINVDNTDDLDAPGLFAISLTTTYVDVNGDKKTRNVYAKITETDLNALKAAMSFYGSQF